jgi:xanthine/CO dehydrogenase XdhC/CoxF family maturation factor
MKERELILDLWRELQEQDSDGVLVTVVKTLGSSYRRPGARLLITESGKRAGSISGGCLEDDVIKKAWWLSEKGPVVRRYDTTPDGEIGPNGEMNGGFGLGCNGIIYLLIQRVRGRDTQATALAVLENVYRTRRPALVAHVLEPAAAIGTFAGDDISDHLKPFARELSASVVTRFDSGEEVFFEMLTPPVRLLIFGAGDDAVPLAELARSLGWQVAVFDGRAHYARRDKFGSTNEIAVRDSSMSLSDLQIDTRTVAVVMTHSYSQDLNFLKALAAEPLAYVGVLGPRNRSEQLLMDAGITPESLPFLHGPAGLDIGADGPEQVALSIIAEIQASMNGRDGGSLRGRSGSIHSRASDGRSAGPFIPSIVCA